MLAGVVALALGGSLLKAAGPAFAAGPAEPVANNDSGVVAEDGAVEINVLQNDTDADGDPLSVSTFTNGANGTVTLVGGRLRYAPNANFNGSDSFTYRATDGANLSNTATVTVTVTAVNDVPVANADSKTTAEDTPLSFPSTDLTANDTPGPSNESSQTLTVISVANRPGGTVSRNPTTGVITFTPTPNFNGPASFVYTVQDNGSPQRTAAGTVNVTVTSVNDAPVAVDDSYSVNEDTVLTVPAPGVLANDTDDSPSKTATKITNPTGGVVNLSSDGSFTYTPNANTNGTDSFTYRVSDGSLNSNTATVTINVVAVNDAPTAVADARTTQEDTPLALSGTNLTANDSKGPANEGSQTLTVTAVSAPVNGTVSLVGGTVTFTPAADFNGIGGFTYTVGDNGTTNGAADPRFASADVVITVFRVNDAPTAAADAKTTNEDTAVSFPVGDLLVNDTAGPADESGQLLALTAVGSPVNGTVDLVGGTITFTPDPNFFGVASFSYTIVDDGTTGGGPDPKQATGTVTVNVTQVSDGPPVAHDDSQTTPEDTTLNASVPPATDPDGEPVTYAVVTGLAGLTFNANGSYSYAPASNAHGTVSFTYKANDGIFDSNDATVTITVTPVNDAPSAAGDAAATAEDTPVEIAASELIANDTPGPADEAGQSLSVTAVGSPVGGTVALAAGTVTFTPTADFNGSASFGYTVTDNGTPAPESATGQVTVTISEANDAPSAVADAKTTAEDTALSFPASDLVANDSAGPSEATQSLTVTAVGSPVGGTVSLVAGTITFTPVADINGPASFGYTVADDGTTNGVADAKEATGTVNVTVSAVNDAPTATDDAKATAEDTQLSFPASELVTNDSKGPANEAGQSLAVNAVGSPVGGTVSLATGTIIFTPSPDFNGPASFSYTVTDDGTSNGAADPQSDSGQVSVSVSEVNDAPTAAADTKTTAEDTALSFPAADLITNDADGPPNEADQSLSVISVQSPVNGTVSLNAGTVTFNPAANFNGAAGFSYTIRDNGTSDGAADPQEATGSVNVTVSAVNDAPVAQDDAETTAEDTTLNASVPAAAEPDGDGVTYALVTGFAGLTFNLNGNYTYVPPSNFNGTVSFTYKANDGTLDSNAATVTITVTPVNDQPVATADAYETAEDTPVSVTAPGVLANDIDIEASPLSAVPEFGPGHGTLTLNANGSLSYTPEANFHGSDTFTYRASDGSLSSNVATVTVTVTPVNDAPVAPDDAASTAEDTVLNSSVPAASDIDGDTVSYALVAGVPGLTFGANGSYTYAPPSNFNGAVSFTYKANDGTVDSNVATITITVTALNDAPVAANDAYTVAEDGSVTIIAPGLLANDSDVDSASLTASKVDNPGNGAVTVNANGSLTYTPAANFNGSDNFTYRANDGALNSNVATVTLTVTEVNDVPVTNDDAKATVEDASLSFPASDLVANDSRGAANEAGQTLTVTSVQGAVDGTVSLLAGTITFNPAADFNGPATFTYTVTDNGTSNSAADPKEATGTVNLTVSEVNDAPLATDDLRATAEDTTLTFEASELLGNDTTGPANESGQMLSVSAVGGALNGTVSLAAGTITFTPSPDFNGPASFSYTVSDDGTTSGVADAKSDTGQVSVSVSEVNDPPTAAADTKTAAEDTALSFPAADLLENDADGPPNEVDQTLSVVAVGSPVNGTVSLNAGTVTFTPSSDFNGAASFGYTIRDDGATNGLADPEEAAGTVTVTVSAVNDAPVTSDDAKAAAEDTALSFSASELTGNDSAGPANEAGQTLNVTAVGGAVNGTVSLAAGTITFTPSADFVGAAAFSYTVTDNGTSNGVADPKEATGTVNVTVSAANDAPGAVDDAQATAEDTPLSLTASELTGNDSAGPANEAAQTLSVTAVGGTVNGTVSLTAGTITFTPSPDFNGAASFNYTVTDNGTTNGAADPKSDSGAVTVTVSEVNDAPTAVTDMKVTDEDASVSFPAADLAANDSAGPANEAGQALSVTAVGSPVGGTVSLITGTVTFTPSPDFNGAAGFSYTIRDNGTTDGAADAKEAGGTVNVTVSAVNDAPTAVDDLKATPEDTVLSFPASELAANDGKGPANEAGQALSVTAVGGAVNGTVSLVDGTVAFTPSSDFNGAASFTYTVTDNGTTNSVADPKSDSGEVTVTVSEVNDAPTAAPDAKATAEDAALSFPAVDLLGNDVAGPPNEVGQSLTVVSVQSPVNGTVTLVAGTITFAPAADFNGAASFRYTVRDNGTSNGGADPKDATGTVNVTVSAVNDVPIANDDAEATAEDTARSFPVSDLLADDSPGPGNEAGQTLSVISVQGAVNGTVSLAAGTVTFTPAADFNGPASFSYTIRDDGASNGLADPKEATGTVNVTVSAVNDAPSAVDDAKTATEDTALSFTAGDLLANDSKGPANESGQSLSVTAVGSPLNGTVSLNAGTITFTPSPDVNGPAGFSYTVSDNGATNGAADPQADSGQVAVTVSEVNDAPTAAADAKTTPEDTALSFPASNLLTNDSCGPANEAGQSLSVSSVQGAVNGTVSLLAGTITFTPAANHTGPSSFSYTIRDNGTSNGLADVRSASGTVNVTVSAVNDAPVAHDDAETTSENTTLSSSVPAGTDVDSAALTYALVAGLPGLSFNADGSYSYTPPTDFNGAVSFTYRANDGTLNSNVATVTITVTEANSAPVAVNDSYSVAEDGSLTIAAPGVLANDNDPESSSVTATLVATATSGTLTLNANGSFTYMPAANFNGSDSFTYKANDGTLDSNVATVTLSVTEVNDVPSAAADAEATTEDTALSFLAADLAANDLPGPANESGQSLTVTAVGGAVNGTVSLNAGTVTFTPSSDFDGAASFGYTIRDNGTSNGAADPKEATGTVNVTVSAVNDAPSAVDDPKATAEDTALSFSASELTGNDSAGPANEAGQTLTVTAVGGAVNGTVSLAAGTITFIPDPEFNGPAGFTYTVSDNGTTNGAADPKSDSGQVSVSVSEVNDPPTAATDAKATAEDTAVSFLASDLLGNDAKGPPNEAVQTLSVIGVSSPANGTVSLEAGTVTFTPAVNYNGAASFAYTVRDDGASNGIADAKDATGTVNVTVSAVNDAPVAHDDTETTAEDTTLTASVPAGTDVDGDALTYQLVAGLPGLTFNATGSYTYTPASDVNGSVSFTYKTSDGPLESNVATVTITVTTVNDAPVTAADAYTVAEDGSLTIAAPGVLANDSDVDSASLTAVKVTNPANGTVTLDANGSLTYTPNANFNGSDSFTYKANDGVLDSNVATVTLTVTAVNDDPIPVTDTKTTAEDTALSFPVGDLLANDSAGPGNENGQTLSVISVGSPVGGTVSLAAGIVTFTPSADFNGPATFGYTIRDNGTTNGVADPKEATGTVNVTVTAVNDAPLAANDSAATAEDTSVDVDVLANDTDIDGGALTVASFSQGTNGSVALVAGNLRYTPNANYHGSDSFTYSASDGTLDSNLATVTISVSELNDDPIVAADARAVAEDQPLNVLASTLVANDSPGPANEAGQALTVTAVGGAVNGTVSLIDGTVTFTPAANHNGSASFTYTVQDNGTTNGAADAKSAIGPVTVTVSEVNDSPTAVADARALAEDQSLSIVASTLTSNDSLGPANEAGQSFTVTGVAGAANGTVSLTAGTITFTPDPDFNGAAGFTYTVEDSGTTNGAADPKSAVGTVTLNVSEVNDAPTAAADTKTAAEDTPLSFPASDLAANDAKGPPNEAGQTLDVISVQSPTNGTVSLADGTVTFTPAPNFSGTAGFGYTIRDNGTSDGAADAKQASGTVSVTVTPVNDAPVAHDNAYATAEETPLTVAAPGVLANDSDVDSASLTATLVATATNGTLTLNASGSFTYTPAGGFSGSDSFTYTASDGTLASNVATVTITVGPINDAPVAVNDSHSLNEDGSLTVAAPGVLANDTDPDSAGLTATLVATTTNGTLSLDADGSFTYTPATNFNGTDSFTYKANDGALDSNIATVTLTVTAVNDAPAAANDAYPVTEDGSLVVAAPGVLGNDSDVDSASLTAAKVSNPANGTVTVDANGSFTYTPAANFHGGDSFTYRANDGTLDSNVATVALTVTAVNDAPVAAADVKATAEDAALSFPAAELLANDSPGPADESGQSLTVTAVGGAVNGNVSLATGSVTFTPDPDFNGAVSFTYTVRDSAGGEATGTVTVNVSNVNDPPTAAADAKTTPEDTALSFPASQLLTNDTAGPPNEGGQSLSVVSVGSPLNGTVSLEAGSVTFTPAANFNGAASFAYTVRDDGTSIGIADAKDATGTVNVTVSPLNDAPVAHDDTETTPEDTTLNASVPAGTDVDGDTLTYMVVTGLPGLSFNATGSYTYTPAINASGTVSFTYKASDAALESNLATVTITVTAVNDAPVAASDAYSLPEDGSLTIAAPGVLANDSDVDSASLTTVKVGDPTNGTVTLNADGSLTYTPAANFNGTDSFTYRANDGALDSILATVTITVTAVNDNPVAAADTKTTAEDTALSFPAADLVANDLAGPANEAGQSLSVIAVGSPVNGTVGLDAGTVTFTPAANHTGPTGFSYTIRDNGTTNGVADPKEATGTVNVTVTAVNDAPLAANDSAATAEDTSVDVDVLGNDVDIDGGALTVASFSQGANGSVAPVAGELRYTPNANYHGSDSFTYSASDGTLDSNLATVTITVTAVNDNPVVATDTTATAEDTPLSFPAADLIANDSTGPANEAGQSLSVISVQGAANGAVTLATGTVTFTPAANHNGPASFTYTVQDNGTTNGTADAKSATGTVTVNVSEVNDNPVAVADSKAAAEDTVLTFPAADLTENDSAGPANEASQSLSVVSVQGAIDGTVSLALGTITFTPSPDFNGAASFTYTVADDGTTNSVADAKQAGGTVNVNVSEVNDAPTAAADARTTAEDTALSFPAADLLTNDAAGPPNESGQTLDVISVGSPVNGTVGLDAGTVTFTPTANHNGAAGFTYTTRDDGTSSGIADPKEASGSVTVTVSAVNDAPVANGNSYSTAEETPLTVAAPGVLANDTDVDSASLSAVKVTDPANGSVTLNATGSFTYTPGAGFTGLDSFTYRASDGTLNSNVATVTIDVGAVNDAPVAVNDAYTLDEDASLSIATPGLLGNDTDIDSASLTATKVANSANGTVTVNANGSFTYTPNPNFNGSDSFTYKANDGAVDSNAATVTLTVAAVNDTPVAVDDAATGAEDGVIDVDVAANDTDVDGSLVNVASFSQGTNGSVALIARELRYTPSANFNGSDSFTYRASDGTLDSNLATVTITVTAVNDTPSAGADVKATAEDTALSFPAAELLANDSPGPANESAQTLAVTAVASPVNGTVLLAAGTVTFTPDPDFNGAASFTYTVRDSAGGEATGTVTVNISTVNDPPTAAADTKATSEDTALSFLATDLLGNDTGGPPNEAGQSLTVTAVGSPVNGTVTLAEGTLTFTPAANFNGAASFAYTVTDNGTTNGTADAKSTPGSVTVNVSAVNDAPAADDNSYSTAEETALTIAAPGVLANDSDVDSPGLSAVKVTEPANGTVSLNANGSFTYTPAGGFSGSDSFTYKASDGTLESNVATVTITVGPINDVPVAVNDSYSVNEDASVTSAAPGVLANDTDPDSVSLTATLVATTTNGTLSHDPDGSFTYTPTANFNGTDSFTYKANDGSLDSSIATVTITVSAVNDTPTATADVKTTPEDTTLSFSATDLLGNDTAGPPNEAGQALSVISVQSPTNGTVTLVDGAVTFTPAANFNGAASFAYTIRDNGTSNGIADAKETSGTVNVTVSAVNDATVAHDDAQTTDEDTILNASVPAATDPDPDTITYALVSGLPGLSFGANGSYSYAPPANFSGTVSFTYEANDGTLDSNLATVTITVTAVNDAPVAGNNTYSVDEDGSLVIAAPGVLANDGDVDSASLTAVKVTNPGNGAVTLNANGSLSYTPAAGFNGSDSFTYTASDGALNSNLATVTIDVGAVNDAPVAVNDTYSVNEDAGLTVTAPGVLGNDTDPDSASLTASKVGNPANGTLTVETSGSFTYTPNANFNGSDSFSYKASDGVLDSSIATVTISVTAVNDAPVAGSDSATTTEDTAIDVDVLTNDTDVDGDSLAVTAVTDGTRGTVTVVDGKPRYAPDTDFHGTDAFSYTVSDGRGGSATATVNLTVNNVAPSATFNAPTSANEGSAINISLSDVVDPGSADTHQYRFKCGLGDWTAYGASAAHSCATSDNGTLMVRGQVRDDDGGESSEYPASVTVNNVAPSATFNAPASVNEGANINPSLSAVVDPGSGDTHQYRFSCDNGATWTDWSSTASHACATTDNGTRNLAGQIRDDDGGASAGYSANVTINNVTPSATVNTSTSVTEGSGINIALTSPSDPSSVDTAAGFEYRFSCDNGTTWTVWASTVSHACATNDNGTRSVKGEIRDKDGGTSSYSASIAVANVAPSATFNAPAAVDEGSPINISLADVVDAGSADTHEYRFSCDDGATWTPYGNDASHACPASDAGTKNVKGEVRDDDGGVSTYAASVTVTGVNNAPGAADDAVSTPEDTPVSVAVLVNDADPEGDTLTITSLTQPANGAVTQVEDELRYAPQANVHGPDSFTYTISDGNGGSNTATVTITVVSVNDAPIAANQIAATAEDTPTAVVLDANDVDLDSLTYSVVAGPTHGALLGSVPNLTYTPAANYNGPDSFTYRANDGSVNSNVATVTISVTSVNDAPIALGDSFSVDHNGSLHVSAPGVLANDFDVESGLSAAAPANPASGTLSLNANGSFTYTPNAGFSGTDTFIYRANDGTLDSNFATVSIAVGQAPPPPPPAADEQAPADPVIQSTSHTVGVGSSDRTIDLTWSGATDNQSGVDGFSFHWDNQPVSMPDTVKDVEETTTGTTSPALSNGSWYFHLRTRDNAGNWSAARHLGPFAISVRTPQQARCVVPSLKGKTVAQARRLLAAGRCGIGRVTRAYSRLTRAGRIVRQSRRPGARLPRGTKVSVVVSLGRRR